MSTTSAPIDPNTASLEDRLQAAKILPRAMMDSLSPEQQQAEWDKAMKKVLEEKAANPNPVLGDAMPMDTGASSSSSSPSDKAEVSSPQQQHQQHPAAMQVDNATTPSPQQQQQQQQQPQQNMQIDDADRERHRVESIVNGLNTYTNIPTQFKDLVMEHMKTTKIQSDKYKRAAARSHQALEEVKQKHSSLKDQYSKAETELQRARSEKRANISKKILSKLNATGASKDEVAHFLKEVDAGAYDSVSPNILSHLVSGPSVNQTVAASGEARARMARQRYSATSLYSPQGASSSSSYREHPETKNVLGLYTDLGHPAVNARVDFDSMWRDPYAPVQSTSMETIAASGEAHRQIGASDRALFDVRSSKGQSVPPNPISHCDRNGVANLLKSDWYDSVTRSGNRVPAHHAGRHFPQIYGEPTPYNKVESRFLSQYYTPEL